MRRFFKRLLGRLTGVRDDRTRLPQPELQLVKQSLALAHSKNHVLSLGDVVRQELPVPEMLRIAQIPRRSSQILVYTAQLLRRKPLGASLPFLVLKTAESSRLEAPVHR